MNIILGEGVYSIGGVDIALTRGGGQFVVERTYRNIEADGDYGPVKGRIRKTMSVAKLTVNALEMLAENLTKLYPATQVTSGGGTDTLTAKVDVEAVDYNSEVKWTGRTMGGRPVVITLYDAINLENIDWTMVDKEEVIPAATMTATYDPTTRTTEPWKVEYLPTTSASAGLSALVITNSASAAVTPTPAFATGKFSYTAAVANAITHVTVTPTAGSHVIKVNGATVVSGQTSGAITISAGELKLITIVAQEPNKSAKTYEIRVFRAT